MIVDSESNVYVVPRRQQAGAFADAPSEINLFGDTERMERWTTAAVRAESANKPLGLDSMLGHHGGGCGTSRNVSIVYSRANNSSTRFIQGPRT